MIRSDKRFHARGGAAVERLLVQLDTFGADRGVGRNRIVLFAANRHGGASQAHRVELLAECRVVEVEVEHRQFDAVVPDILELLADRQHFVGHFAGPKKEIHSVFHRRQFLFYGLGKSGKGCRSSGACSSL